MATSKPGSGGPIITFHITSTSADGALSVRFRLTHHARGRSKLLEYYGHARFVGLDESNRSIGIVDKWSRVNKPMDADQPCELDLAGERNWICDVVTEYQNKQNGIQVVKFGFFLEPGYRINWKIHLKMFGFDIDRGTPGENEMPGWI